MIEQPVEDAAELSGGVKPLRWGTILEDVLHALNQRPLDGALTPRGNLLGFRNQEWYRPSSDPLGGLPLSPCIYEV